MSSLEPLPFIGLGQRERLCESFLHEGQFLCTAVRNDGTIVYVTAGVRNLLGYEPADLVGRNILDLIHHDDLERAVLQLTSAIGGTLITGITRFQVLHKSGEWGPLEVFGGAVSDGTEELIGIYARNPLHQVVVEDILALLLRGVPREQVLVPVCDVIQWREHGSHFSISWLDESGFHQIGTDLPAGLGEAEVRPGTPWDLRRTTVGGRVEGLAENLPQDLRDLAAQAEVTMYWVERVEWSKSRPPALLTIWTRGGLITPGVHSYGMSVARDMVELILGWTEQVEEMSRAARLDSLTGLANRRSFFAELGQSHRGGSLLYCDLDNFKPVNDTLGHAAGDALLGLTARRIESCVREGDVVARLGGDEFGVLCAGASPAEAGEVAERIKLALSEPFSIGESQVRVSVSVGIASDDDFLDETLLGLADRALYQAKYEGGSAVRSASRSTPPH